MKAAYPNQLDYVGVGSRGVGWVVVVWPDHFLLFFSFSIEWWWCCRRWQISYVTNEKNKCACRESKPSRLLGRQISCHWTTSARVVVNVLFFSLFIEKQVKNKNSNSILIQKSRASPYPIPQAQNPSIHQSKSQHFRIIQMPDGTYRSKKSTTTTFEHSILLFWLLITQQLSNFNKNKLRTTFQDLSILFWIHQVKFTSTSTSTSVWCLSVVCVVWCVCGDDLSNHNKKKNEFQRRDLNSGLAGESRIS